jgi:hypothetical protein
MHEIFLAVFIGIILVINMHLVTMVYHFQYGEPTIEEDAQLEVPAECPA